MEPGLTQIQVSLRDFFVLSAPSLTTAMPVMVQPVSSVSLPTDPQENQGKVVINISDRTTDEAAINTSEVVLELLLETFLTTGLLCFLVLKLDK